MDKQFRPALYDGCTYLSKLGLKWIYVSPDSRPYRRTALEGLWLSCWYHIYPTNRKLSRAIHFPLLHVLFMYFAEYIVALSSFIYLFILLFFLFFFLGGGGGGVLCAWWRYQMGGGGGGGGGFCVHDDVIKWKHFPRYWTFVQGIHWSPVNSPHKGQWRGALMFSLICAWINERVNNREFGDLRRHRAHYNVTVMYIFGSNRDNVNRLSNFGQLSIHHPLPSGQAHPLFSWDKLSW